MKAFNILYGVNKKPIYEKKFVKIYLTFELGTH